MPYSLGKHDKIGEDLKALGTEDPNAVQALIRDASFPPPVAVLDSRQETHVLREAEHSVNAETMLEAIKSLKGDTDPEAARIIATLERHAGKNGNDSRLNSRTYILGKGLNVSRIALTIPTDCSYFARTTPLITSTLIRTHRLSSKRLREVSV